MQRIEIGSPEVTKYVDSELDQAEYRQFLLDVGKAARAGFPAELYAKTEPVEGEVVDDKDGK